MGDEYPEHVLDVSVGTYDDGSVFVEFNGEEYAMSESSAINLWTALMDITGDSDDG